MKRNRPQLNLIDMEELQRMVTIFCSYSSQDALWVTPYRDLLTAAGHSMYLFQDDQQPGKSIAAKVRREIDKAEVVLAFITRYSVHSSYVQQEIGYALKAGKPIVPLIEVGITNVGMLEGLESLPFHRNKRPEQLAPEGCNSLLHYLHQVSMKRSRREEAVLLP